jgi:hypothetical protein
MLVDDEQKYSLFNRINTHSTILYHHLVSPWGE